MGEPLYINRVLLNCHGRGPVTLMLGRAAGGSGDSRQEDRESSGLWRAAKAEARAGAMQRSHRAGRSHKGRLCGGGRTALFVAAGENAG